MAGKGKIPMAVRHDVENLTGEHASPCRSRGADRAAVFHSTLNMLMAELKLKQKEPMSKEQFQKLCAHERDGALSASTAFRITAIALSGSPAWLPSLVSR